MEELKKFKFAVNGNHNKNILLSNEIFEAKNFKGALVMMIARFGHLSSIKGVNVTEEKFRGSDIINVLEEIE